MHLETQAVFRSPSQNSLSDDSLEKGIEEDKNDVIDTVPRKPSKNDEGDSQ